MVGILQERGGPRRKDAGLHRQGGKVSIIGYL
jgi:hypothetical protein